MRVFRMLGRQIIDAFKNIFRQGWMSFSAILSVAVTLFLTSLVVVLLINITYITNAMEQDIAIYVSLDKEITTNQAAEMQQEIKQIPNVVSVAYQSEDQELDDLIKYYGEDGKIFEDYRETNPLKKTFTIKLDDSKDYQTVINAVKNIDGVYEVKYQTETAEKIFAVFGTIQYVGVGLSAVVGIVALILISNTIRITIIARRVEIEIMRLVGASNWFIRTPFILEGIFIGIIGAAIPIGLVLGGYYYFFDSIQASMTIFAFAPFEVIALPVTVFVGALGVAIGFIGSLLPVGKFLKK
ncbi:permease-like cell division protein FtsX [Culicoidibacter larvae]|nr:permease-like cell division protein FtsX [Culicoidibacter larvae]